MVVQIRPGHETNSAKMRNRLVRDQINAADKLANTLDQMERASREVDKVACNIQKKSTKKSPFYPPPNRTTNPKKSLRQGSSKRETNGYAEGRSKGTMANHTSNACTADDRAEWDTVDMIPTNLNEELSDFQAKVKHYQDQVEDLNGVVDGLRDDLDVEKAAAIKAEAEMLAAGETQRAIDERVAAQLRLRHLQGYPAGYPYPPPPIPGRPLPPPPLPSVDPRILPSVYPYDASLQYPHIPPLHPVLDNINAYNIHNIELQKMLQELKLNGQAAEQRDVVLQQLKESELLNSRLKCDLAAREGEIADLGVKVAQTGELQLAFETLQDQTKAAKKELQNKLHKKEMECMKKEEEIITLKARSQIVVQSASDVRAATEEAISKTKKDAAADLAMTQATIANIAEAAEQRKKVFKKENKEARRNLKLAENEIRQLQQRVAKAEAVAEARTKVDEKNVELEVELRNNKETLQSTMNVNKDLQARLETSERQLILETERSREMQAQLADTTTHLQAYTRRAEVAETRSQALQNELTDATSLSNETTTTLEATRQSFIDATANLDRAENDLAAYKQSSEALQQELIETKTNHAEMEIKTRQQIQDLEMELKKALEVVENLERIREDQQRIADAKIWDLKEQLDYANTARRSLQNYSNYVRSAYNDVFDGSRCC